MKKIWIGTAAIIFACCMLFLLENFDFSFRSNTETSESKEDPKSEGESLYDIDVTGLNIIQGTVSKNQTLGSILAPFNVPYQIIDQLAQKSKEIFDVRKISVNKKFTILTANDSTSAQFFIYEPNPAEYVVFSIDSIFIYKAQKPAEFRKREVGGIIKNSLYVDMIGQQVTPDLIDQFADLYGWSVDFQRLQKGDKFKVVYEEKLIDGIVVGVSPIELAYFEHMGVPYHAIPFQQNGEVTFFDQEGNSLKKAFLRDPLKYTRISSRYNLNRFHPVQKRYKAHLGTDYAAPRGTEIRSIGEGTVLEAKFSSANGNYVKIKHNGTYTTQYLHMSKIGNGVKPGTRVKQGQVIGYVGSTGLATGPHLCFRFWKNGKQEDWLREKIPPSEPVSKSLRIAFESKKGEAMTHLAKISVNSESKKMLGRNIPEEMRTPGH